MSVVYERQLNPQKRYTHIHTRALSIYQIKNSASVIYY